MLPVSVIAAPTLPALVTAEWLVKHAETCLVIDTRGARDYAAGHIPGSISLPLDNLMIEDSSTPALTRLAHAAQRSLAVRGVTPDQRVVLVDDGDGSASIAVHVLRMAGIREAAASPGGVRCWYWHTHDLTTDVPTLAAADWDAQIDLSSVATFEQLVEAAGDEHARLVDTRSQLEHEGIVGAPCCPYRGHIPGSVHLEWTCLLGPTGEMASAERVAAEAARVGLERDDDIVVYCHSGVRSAVMALALEAAGYERVRNSLGSWHEWSNRSMPAGPER